ncbi:hypothetical protein [Facklamia sp. P9177]|uniref:hypothetical protein n=1 Tax=Facklamia sp. P9177 TaxID=3421945 RepID=UPI003D182CB8
MYKKNMWLIIANVVLLLSMCVLIYIVYETGNYGYIGIIGSTIPLIIAGNKYYNNKKSKK